MSVPTYPDPKADGPIWSTCRAALLGTYKNLGLMRLHETLRASWATPYMTIFLFHRVTDAIPPDGLTVSTAWFRDFCRLMKASYHVETLGETMRILAAGETPRRRTVTITFDDSYADNFEAARVLHEHGLPATFFIPTQYVETTLRYPWDAHLPPLPNLTWAEIRQMVQWGHDIGSHSVSHPNFRELGDAAALKELIDSRAVLQERLDRPIDWFAFPFGASANFRPEQAQLVAQAGYKGSFSAIHGFIEKGMTEPILPREAVPYFRNLTHLEMHINRCLDGLYRVKRWAGYIP